MRLLVAERAAEVAQLVALQLLRGDRLRVEVDREQLGRRRELRDRDVARCGRGERRALREAEDRAAGDEGESAASGPPKELRACDVGHLCCLLFVRGRGDWAPRGRRLRCLAPAASLPSGLVRLRKPYARRGRPDHRCRRTGAMPGSVAAIDARRHHQRERAARPARRRRRSAARRRRAARRCARAPGPRRPGRDRGMTRARARCCGRPARGSGGGPPPITRAERASADSR